MHHMLWCCEGRRVSTVLNMPENHSDWPAHLKLRGLITKECNIDSFDLWQFQHFATTTLIDRREDEKALARVDPKAADRDLDDLA
eukprot:54658-Amphidinium_carterae.1